MRFLNNDIVGYGSHRLKISENLVGGKAKNLFSLYRRGFKVPPWLVITSDVFERLAEPVQNSIMSIISSIDFADRSRVDLASLEIRDIILNLNIPRPFVDRLKREIQIKLGVSTKFAVRSSVVGEDSNINSFAGQMDSFLNISYNNIIDSIKKVWASAYSSRALVYRNQKNMNSDVFGVAVIVQTMVESTKSGVMYTRSPQTGEKEIWISAGYGLGEGVVQDLVETDTYRLKWDSNQITRDIIGKKLKIVADAGSDGTRMQLINDSQQMQTVLSDKEILSLGRTGRKVERQFGLPQDIEWTIDRKGEMYIVQSRPAIIRIEPNNRTEYKIWDNSNIVESYPGLTLPLTFSFIQQCYEIAFKKAAGGCLLFKKQLKDELHIFKNMIGLLDGRVYYNLVNWYKMLSYLPGYKNHKKSWDQMIGITHKCDFPQTRLSPANRLFSVIIVAFRLLAIEHNASLFFRKFRKSYERYTYIKFSSLSEDELVDLYHTVERDFSPVWHRTLYNDFCAMKYYDWLKILCQRWGLGGFPNLHNNLLCGEPNIESVRPVHELIDLAEQVRSNPDYKSLFQNDNNYEIWISIITDSKYLILRDKLSFYLKKYGDRGLEELKLEVPAYRDDPEALIKLIKEYSKTDLTVQLMQRREMCIRKSAEKVIRENIRNRWKRVVFRFVLKNARRSIVNRENMRFARSRLYGIVKRLFKRMAGLFVEREILDSPEDIYYLTVPEVLDYVRGASVNQNLKEIAEMRKKEYMQFKDRCPGARIHHSGIPYLNSLCECKEIESRKTILKGIGCSSGMTEGIARVVNDPHETINEKDYILIAKSTDPGWVFLMVQSKGIVVEKGSVLSHTAIIGRELGIPTIVAVDRATTSIRNGDVIHIDGSTGVVKCA